MPSKVQRHPRQILAAGLITVCAIVESLCYSQLRPEPSIDEVKCSIPTVQFVMTHKRPILFVYSSAYMAPLLEMVVVPLCVLTNVAPLTAIRIVGSIFLGLSAFVLFQVLALEFGLAFSAIVTMAFALATPWLFFWKLTMPGYPAGIFCCFGFLYIFLKARPPWLVTGLLAGLLHYLFPISIAFIITVFFVTLEWRAIVDTISVRLRSFNLPRRTQIIAGIVIVAEVLFSVVLLYEILTGRFKGVQTVAGAWGIFTGATSGLLLFLAWAKRPGDMRALLKYFTAPALYVCGFALIEVPVKLVFQFVEVPYFSKMGLQLWAGNTYSWKQWHEWPQQCLAFVGRLAVQSVFPISGRNWISTYEQPLRPGFEILIGLCVLLSIFFALASRGRFHLNCPSGIFFAAFSIHSLLLLPSWRLFGDPSVRYLTPYFPACYVAMAIVASHSIAVLARKGR